MNLDYFLTTAEMAHLLRYHVRQVKNPNAAATKWAKTRGIRPADGGSTKLWPRDAVTKAMHPTPRRRRTTA